MSVRRPTFRFHRSRASVLAAALLALVLTLGSVGAIAAPDAVGTTPVSSPGLPDREIVRLQRGGEKIAKRLGAQAAAGASYDQQRDLIVAGITKLGIKPTAARRAVARYGAPGIALRPTKATAVTSRLGGDAVMTADAVTSRDPSWPVNRRTRSPLSVLAVLDLAELRAPAPLPPDGTLVLYYDASGQDADPTDAWLDIAANAEIRWIPPGTPTTVVPAPKTATTYPVQPLGGTPVYIVGGIYEVWFGPSRRTSAAKAYEALFGMGAAYTPDQLLGASQDIQGPALDEFAYWFKETSIASTRARFSADERKGKGWTLVAQISGAGSDEMMFGDAGNVSFAVPTADLLSRRFDRAVAIVQSS